MMMTMMTSTRRTRRTPTHLYAKESTEVKQQQQQRQPWNIFRFAQQTSKFVSFPFALTLNNNGNNNQKMIRPGDVLWTPTSTTSSSQQHEQRFFQWAPLDDVVMGGASYSTMDNGLGLWKGVVTDANNGGFVGIRTTPNVRLDLSPCRGLEFSLECPANNDNDDDDNNNNNNKNDIVIMPRRLKVVLRDSTDFNGIAWTTTVDVPNNNNNNSNNTKNNTVVKVKVPVNAKSLLPTIFARIVKNERTTSKDGICKTDITGLQLVYSKFELEGELNPQFQQGNFALKLLEVKAY